MARPQLGARLALAFVAVALAAIGVLGGLALVGARNEVADLVERRRDDDTAQIAAALAQAYSDGGGWAAADLTGAFALAASARAELVVLGAEGDVVATMPPTMGELMDRMHGEDVSHHSDELGDPRRAVIEVERADVGTAQLRFPSTASDSERRVRDALTQRVLTGAAIAALAALAVAVFVSRRLTRPLQALTEAARRVEAGDRNARVDMAGAPGELGELAAAFNQMADSLHREDRLRRTLVADVAHELRTPVTILRASCEEMVDGLAAPTPERLSSLHDEVLRLGRVVEDLEALAGAQAAAIHLERAEVDLAATVTQAAELLRPHFADAGLGLSIVATPALVDGDAGRLHQVAVNLLTNAQKFTPTGGDVTVSVEPIEALAKLTVSDTGPGIPAEEIDHVFDRFWRGSGADRSAGSGIGLAIVAELVKAHGGTVTADSQHGAGTTFTVLLPRRPCPVSEPSEGARRGR